MKWNQEKVFGLVFVIIGIVILYSFLLLLHQDVVTPKEKIGLAYSNNIDLNKIFFYFNTSTSPELVHINYTLSRPMDKSGFIIIVLPYDGKIAISNSGWQEETLGSLQTTILFKKFDKSNSTSIDNDHDDVYFVLTNSINSYRFPTNYLSIPFFNNPLDKDLSASINGITNNTNFNSWNKINGPSEVSVILSNEYDSLTTQPTANLTSEGNNLVAHWKITDNDPLYVLDFTNSQTRLFGSIVQTLGGVLLGSGFGLIVTGKTRQRGEENQTKLQNFIKVQRHMQDANTSFILKNYESAKNSYDLAIKIDPKDVEPMILAGNSFYEMKRYDEAIPYYKKILEINPKHVGALNNIGACIAGLKKHDDAMDYYEQALDVDPNHRDAINNMGASIMDLDFPEYAEPYFDEVLQMDGKDVVALTNKAKVLLKKENYKSALEYCDTALKIKLDHIDALNQKTSAFFSLKQFDEMITCCNVILKIEPNNLQAKYNKAFALMQQEKYAEALALIDEYIIIDSKKSEALELKAQCLDGIGTKKLNENKSEAMQYLQKALEYLNKALEVDPESIETLNNQSLIIGKLGNHQESLRLLEVVLQREPQNIMILMNKALALTDLGRKTDAITDGYDVILSIDGSNTLALERKGRVLISLGEYTRAINECLDPLLNSSKNNLDLLHLKAEALRKNLQTEEAIIVYDRILAIDPDDTVAINDKGLCLMDLKQYQEAIDECFDKTLRIDNKNIFALINKGTSLYYLEKYAESIDDCYDKVLDIDARNSRAWYNKYWSLTALGRGSEAKICFQESEKYKEIEDRKKSI